MNILVVLDEPHIGMVSGWPTRYIGIISQLYKKHKLSIFAPGDTTLLKSVFPDADVCASTSIDNVVTSRFSLGKYIFSFFFPDRNNIFFNGFQYYPEFDNLLHSQHKRRYDVVFYSGMKSYNYYYYHNFDNAPVICDFCDSGLRHLLTYLNNEKNLKKRITTYSDIAYLYRVKRKIVKHDVNILAATDKDAFYIKKILKKNRVFAVVNGIETDKITFDENYCLTKWKSRKILFCGSLDYEPNIITIRYILEELWIPLKDVCPDIELEIVGRNLSKDFADFIAQFKDVLVFADVPDVFKYYKAAKLVLSPLFSGSGIKNKILEALSTATPIVTNSEGATGIELETEKHGYVMENKNDFIRTAEKILKSDFDQYKMWCENCYSLSKEYSWDRIGEKLEDIIETKLAK